MKTYLVGGSVRDTLLGLPVKDLDYVVTGSTPEQMITAGYTPVGKDFPVFLHPTTHAEYALARTERKSAPGYHGFVFHCAPDVTIEQDLGRRDLTINAMAIAQGDVASKIIDPFGGQKDLAAKIFRHVSNAFSEDPVRILRVARFAARFNTFTIAPETMQLMRAMVQSGEVNALVPERVWQEIARGLMENHPSRMMEVLRDANAIGRIMPELDAMLDERMNQVVDHAARLGFSLAVRWAAMLAECNNAAQLNARLKVPTEVRDISLLAIKERKHIERAPLLDPQSVVHLFERCDAFRRPDRFSQIIQAIKSIQCVDPTTFLERALTAAKAVPAGKIAQATIPNEPQKIADAISAARVEAIRNMS